MGVDYGVAILQHIPRDLHTVRILLSSVAFWVYMAKH